MKLEVRYNNHPNDSKSYDTKTLRDRYLIEEVFVKDEINLTYSHHDRIIAGGVLPVDKKLELPVTKDLGTDFFLERRELGVINVGGAGVIELDGESYDMAARDGLYVGAGVKVVSFSSVDKNNPAKFYVNSAPAHQAFPIVHIPFKNANPRHLGDPKALNVRTIYQYVHPAVCQSCQLVMGMTVLEPGNVWNTMPCHTHERRMEVYFYFDMQPDTRVFHFMGQPQETRHLVVATSNYTFIWGMCGENITFDDMDFVDTKDLK